MKCDSLTGPQVVGDSDGVAAGAELFGRSASAGSDSSRRRHGGTSGGHAVSGQRLVHLQGADPAPAHRGRQRQPRRGHRPRKLSAAQEVALAEHITGYPDITLAALQAWLLSEHGVRLSNGAMWSTVARLGLSFKKTYGPPRPQEACAS